MSRSYIYKTYFLITSFFTSAFVFSLLSFIQKSLVGFYAFNLRSYIVPIICGGVAGTLIGLYIYKLKLKDLELQEADLKLKKAFDGTVDSLIQAIECRDNYTIGHSRNVSKLSCKIAKKMGLAEEVIDTLSVAGILHDIGKISIPTRILVKVPPLIPEEFDIIKTHPKMGYDLVKNIDFGSPKISRVILEHHERLDGTGYPNGLKEDETLLESKIIAVADSVEAMSLDRPYRKGYGIEKALKEVVKGKGTLYDASVVDACLKVFKEDHFKFS